MNAFTAKSNGLDVHCNDIDTYECVVNEQLDIHEPTVLNFIDAGDWNDAFVFTIPSHNNVTIMPSGFFTRFPKLTQIILSTGLESIKKDDFKNAKHLNILHLNGNKLQIIPNSVFIEAPQLTETDLSDNRLVTIEDFAFNSLRKLNFVFLRANRLTTLKRNTFVGAPNLIGLNLENNQIETIEDGTFDLPKLRSLFLSTNLIRAFSDNVFSGAPNLFALSVTANGLFHIGQSLYKLNNLNAVVLDHNRIDDIDLVPFAKMPALMQLSLKNSGLSFRKNDRNDSTTVNSPVTYLDLSQNNLTSNDVLKQLKSMGYVNLEELDLEDNAFTDVDDIVDIKQKFRNIATLGLSGNRLTCKWIQDAYNALRPLQVILTKAEDTEAGNNSNKIYGINCLK